MFTFDAKAFICCDFIAAELHLVHWSFNQSHPTICIAFLCKMDTGMVVTLYACVFMGDDKNSSSGIRNQNNGIEN